MKTKGKPVKFLISLTLIIYAFLLGPSFVFAVSMTDYCIVPPYVKRDIEPNVLILFDNSSNMKGAAYDSNNDGTLDAYDSSKTYEGYFYSTLYYSFASNVFTPDINGIYKGNLLNWATTSKFDLLMKILVDGKSTSEVGIPKHLWNETDTWSGDYSGCRFSVSSNNLTVSDITASSCILLNGTRLSASLENNDGKSMNFAKNINTSEEGKGIFKNLLSSLFYNVKAFGSRVMNFAVPEAYAAVPLSIKNNPSPGNGTVCVVYSVTLQAQGGTTPYTWSISAGTLPSGLSIGSSTGTISGTPTTANSYNFTVQVTDNVGATATKAYSVTIGAAPALSISTTTLPDATQGGAYSATLSSNGGCGTKTWSITSGSLPTGLSICNGPANCVVGSDTYTPGMIYGTTSDPVSTYNFTARVDDSTGFATKALSLTVVVGTSIRSSTAMSLKVCRGDYSNNCDNSNQPAKQGILQLFTDKARMGLAQFNKTSGNPEVPTGTCIAADQSSNFYTQVENVQVYTSITNLVNGEYTAINEFMTDTSSTCDPFRDTTNSCMKNFVLMITDGQGANSGTNVYTDATNCIAAKGINYNLSQNSCYGYNDDLRTNCASPDNPTGCKDGKQVVNTYIVNIMGTYTCGGVSCNTILAEAATKSEGVYYPVTDPTTLRDYLMQAFQDIIKRAAAGTAASVLASGEGSGANLIQAVFYPRRKFFNSGTGSYDEISWIGRLSNLWYYVDPFFTSSNLRADGGDKILNLDTDIGNDYIVQLYYDSTTEATKAKRWEDTDGDGYANGSQLSPDIEFENLGNLWEAGVELWKRDLSTSPRTIYTNCSIDSSSCITVNGVNTGLMNFSTGNASVLRPYLVLPTTDGDLDGWLDGDLNHDSGVDDTDATILIRYVHGEDVYSWLRSRTVKVDLNGDGDTADTNVGGYDETVARVWKLGDVLNSTPKISSWLPLNSYQKAYNDNTYGQIGKDPSLSDTADSNYYITRDTAPSGVDDTGLGSTIDGYRRRNMVFAGGNDGMLHAFKLGTLELKWSAQTSTQKARMTGSDLGKEMWAFIPKNVLPYLKYMAETGYCHLYSVDLTPYIFDASINIDWDTNDDDTINASDTQPLECSSSEYWRCTKTKDSWRTILIGGMRFGGACRGTSTACSDVSGDGAKDCVNTPADISGSSVGFSSYFALDVTDQNNPRLLWEFSDPALGFTTTGPSIVRINARTVSGSTSTVDPNKNGRWFIVLGSGPTGPIDTTAQQFLGYSDQNLKVFILDLKTGSLLRTIDTSVPYAFAGSMLNVTHDTDLDYQDDVVYIPYVQRTGTSPNYTWTDGGLGRIITNEDSNGSDITSTGTTAINPANWAWSTVIANIGPLTSSVVRLQNSKTGKLWLYFGTGRYYYEIGSTTDDPTNQRQLFGITEPCFQNNGFTTTCTTSRTVGQLTPVDLTTTSGVSDAEGWYIDLDLCTNSSDIGVSCSDSTAYYKAERVITDPLATSSGIVFFTTYKPYKDECSLGGKSALWALKYDTGGSAGALLKGKALIQVSTGSIEQKELSTAFSDKGGRRTSLIEGVPPTAQGLSLVTAPPPLKKILHIKER